MQILVYVTGDIHGDLTRLKSKELRRLKKNDYLIVCGDFGFIWDGSPAEKRVLKWIGRRRFHVLFVEGSHDNYDLLLQYPKEPWMGGEVRRISGRLLHLCRGGVFAIDGHKVFAFGGGESGDADERSAGNTWWREELPTLEEIEEARKSLAAHGNKVDYIVTHQCSRRIKTFLSLSENEANVMDVFFDEIRENCTFKKWFFGSLHIDKLIPPSEVSLFQSFIKMEPNGVFFGYKRRKPRK